MKVVEGNVEFDNDEVSRFMPVWLAIASDDAELHEKRRALSEKLPFIDEVSLVKGRAPILKEARPFSEFIKNEAKKLNENWTHEELSDFSFFVLRVQQSIINNYLKYKNK